MSSLPHEMDGHTQKLQLQDADRPDRRLAQPFSGWTLEQMNDSIEEFIDHSELHDWAHYIRRGAFLAQSKDAFPRDQERLDGLKLKEFERRYLDLDYSERRIDMFNQPWRLYALVGVCSLGAAVQGWYVRTKQMMRTHVHTTQGRDGG